VGALLFVAYLLALVAGWMNLGLPLYIRWN
jgi:hypothetical protein